MAFDTHSLQAYSTVATAPSPATSGTSLTVASGDGVKFHVNQNCTVWAAGQQPTLANSEIVRITGISTDTLTITRTQEGSSARTVVIGDQIANTITPKVFTDIESGGLLTAAALGLTGSVLTQANGGTAGGTMFYINLGGLKLLWLTGASCATGSTATVTFPTSFFATIQLVVPGIAQASGTAALYMPESRSITATGYTMALTAAAGSGTEPMFGFVIGT